MASELESDLQDSFEWDRKWLVDFNAGKSQLVSFNRSSNIVAINVKMDGFVLEEKSSYKMMGIDFSSKLDWGSYIISIAKTALSLDSFHEVTFSCMEYSFHVWVGAPSCYLELLDKLQKRICRTFGPSLTASLKPLAHRRNVAS